VPDALRQAGPDNGSSRIKKKAVTIPLKSRRISQSKNEKIIWLKDYYERSVLRRAERRSDRQIHRRGIASEDL
jgi:hypothetical protein